MNDLNFFSKRRGIAFLLLFLFIGGTLYIFFTPPWQAPDENVHYEYTHILSRAELFHFKQKPDLDLQEKIIQSMDRFHAWEYVHRKAPSPLPEKFSRCPLYRESVSKVNRPPLYYFLGSLVLKFFKNNHLLVNHYLLRFLSLLLTLITIYLVYRSAQLVFEKDPFSVIASTFFAAFLPQFLFTSSSINSDVLANLVGALGVFLFLYSLKKYQNFSIFLLGPVIIALGLLTKRTTFFLIPVFIIYVVIFFYKNFKSNKLKALGFVGGLISFCAAAYFLFLQIFPSLYERIEEFLFHWGGGLKELNKFLSPGYYSQFDLNFIETLFKSFWFCPGWMAFPLSNSIYHVLKLVTLLGIVGVVIFLGRKVGRREQGNSIKSEYIILLISICLMALLSIFVRFDFNELPMARYTFPALSAFSILFLMGIREFIPEKVKKPALMVFIFLLTALNIYGVFGHLVNSFYFRYLY